MSPTSGVVYLRNFVQDHLFSRFQSIWPNYLFFQKQIVPEDPHKTSGKHYSVKFAETLRKDKSGGPTFWAHFTAEGVQKSEGHADFLPSDVGSIVVSPKSGTFVSANITKLFFPLFL